MRNLLTITAPALDAFPSIENYEAVIEDGKIVLTPVKLPSQNEMDCHFASLNLTEEDIQRRRCLGPGPKCARKNKPTMRVVIDTNVLVPVMVFPLGAMAWVRVPGGLRCGGEDGAIAVTPALLH